MITLIFVVLCMILMVEALSLYRLILSQGRELSVMVMNQHIYERKIKELEERALEDLKTVKALYKEQFDKTAFVICADGVKALPADWRKIL